jgi:hypothetical protein
MNFQVLTGKYRQYNLMHAAFITARTTEHP